MCEQPAHSGGRLVESLPVLVLLRQPVHLLPRPVLPLGPCVFEREVFEQLALFVVFVAALVFGAGEVADELGVVGLEVEGLAVVVDGVVEFAGGFEDQAEVVLRLGSERHELDGVLELPGGVVELVLLVEDLAEVVVGGAEGDVGLESSAEFGFGFLELALFQEVQGLGVEGAGGGGVAGELGVSGFVGAGRG